MLFPDLGIRYWGVFIFENSSSCTFMIQAPFRCCFTKGLLNKKGNLITDCVAFQNLAKSTLQSLGLPTPTFGFLDKIQTCVCLGFTILGTPAGCPIINSILTLPTTGQHQIPQAKGSVL